MATTMRRRRPNDSSTTTDDKSNNNKQQDAEEKFLDTDDQERIIQTMALEMEQQQTLIGSAFRLVCIGAIVTTLLGSLLLEIRHDKQLLQLAPAVHPHPPMVQLLRWTHVVLSAFLHGSASYIATSLPSTKEFKWILYIPSFVSLVVGANALFLLRMALQQPTASEELQDSTTTDMMMWLHQGMMVANVLTILGGLYLRWDALDIQESLQDLKASKYRYKSL